jgi:hypothetical protein
MGTNICPTCGANLNKPTSRQQEAYRLTRIHDCTQEEAALIMGISHQAVSRVLQRLGKNFPELFSDESVHIKRKKPFSFNENIDSMPKRKF